MNLREQYNDKLDRRVINPDPFQEQAVELLQDADDRLKTRSVTTTKTANKGFFSFFSKSETREVDNISQGVYLWGGVGRGKTWLMDLFYDSVAIEQKKRYHFHHIIEKLHKAIKQHADQEDPLKAIAKEWAKDMRLLCLDELHLTEIANARLLLPLLEHLMRNGVLLVTTSNRAPHEVYQGNLKKELFTPYTRFLEENMAVFHLDSKQDYRTLGLDIDGDAAQAALAALSETELEARFEVLSEGEVRHDQVFVINHREVLIKRVSDNIIWLDFQEACETDRVVSDYIWMADRYETIMLSNVHVMKADDDPAARRFFNLIDEVYDRDMRLLFSSDVHIRQLYQGSKLQFAFKRVLSRLTAMYLDNRGEE